LHQTNASTRRLPRVAAPRHRRDRPDISNPVESTAVGNKIVDVGRRVVPCGHPGATFALSRPLERRDHDERPPFPPEALLGPLLTRYPGGAGGRLIRSAGERPDPGIPSVGSRFAQRGPYRVTVAREATHTYYSPTTLGAAGVRHPVIPWGNGTNTSPAIYDALLRHLASHGFIVAAANMAGASGEAILAGLDNLSRYNNQAGHRFYGVVDTSWVGTTGHSMGGGGAITAGNDARVNTVFPIEPYRGRRASGAPHF
jgi:hypothetical protein